MTERSKDSWTLVEQNNGCCCKIHPSLNEWYCFLRQVTARKFILYTVSSLSSLKLPLLWGDLDQDQWSEITQIMVHQRNRWIHFDRGFIGSFDAPWSEWSWSRSFHHFETLPSLLRSRFLDVTQKSFPWHPKKQLRRRVCQAFLPFLPCFIFPRRACSQARKTDFEKV